MGLVLGASSAHAAAGPWWTTDQGAVRLIAETGAVGSTGSLRAGLQFHMKPGWKVYWRSPGDAGFPPQPNWADSRNVASVKIDWPAPERFEVLGLQTLGYHDDVVLPLTVALFEPGKPVLLRAKVRYLTCAEICVPYEANVGLSLPPGPAITSPEAALIARFADRVPVTGPLAPFQVAGAWAEGAPGHQSIRVVARAQRPFARPDLVIEGPPGFRFGPPKITLGRDRREAVALAAVSPPPRSVRKGRPADLTGSPVTLTVIDGGRGAEIHARAMPALPALAARGQAAPAKWGVLIGVLGLALLGGLILNLMPCVLPVLSLKLLSVIGHGGSTDRAGVRRGFLASAAGILASFMVLGTAAVALKAAGHAAGWGIQFQQPVFLAAMAAVVALFAANLWGLFEIRLPGAVADLATGIARSPERGGSRSLAGHFATGAFATLLATPCSAPFLGTAVGFALARGPFEIYAVFAALGVGLALPYLAVAAVPALATCLPRPGRWMKTLRRVLALALAGTAGWLLGVLSTQAGVVSALAAGVAVVAIPLLLVLHRVWPNVRPRVLWGGVATLAVAAAILPVPFAVDGTKPGVVVAHGIRWQPFAPAAIAAQVAAGKTVFVDVTADWCITCQVNEALVLDRDDIRARLNADGVVAMRADWTRADPAITAFLKRFSRYGIPFNVAFGPGAPAGHPLPELLTATAVRSALDAARGSAGLAGR